MATGLLIGLLTQLELVERLHSFADVNVEQHAEVDDVAGKSAWHVNSSYYILTLLTDPPSPLLGVV